jgi:integrase
MPLKLIPPRKSPNWSIRGTYLGRYIDRSSGSGKRAVAAKVLKGIERQIERGAYAEPGEATFASAAASYMKAGGERTYVRLLATPFRRHTTVSHRPSRYRRGRAALYPSGSAATRNRQVYTPVSAILRHAGSEWIIRRPRGSGGNKQTAWLWPEQAEAIFEEAHKLDPAFAALCITLCYTGMRLSEALGLTWNDVRLEDGFAYIPDTKNDEPRAVFLPPVAVAALASLQVMRAGNARVFRYSKSGHLYHALKATAFRAGVDLPERSAFHIFRHTYMTWMRRYAGLDELGLLNLGTHKDRKSVGRYTHVVVSEEARRAALLPVGKIRGIA